jgi:damage-control phosphatase, subfamily I
MKFVPQCLSCFIDDVLGAVEMLGVPQKQTLLILQDVTLYLSKHVGDDVPPSYFITDLHRIIKRRLGLALPFADSRQACLEAGRVIAAAVERESDRMAEIDKFKFLIRWAVASNSLDFRTAGAGYGLSTTSIEKTIRGYFDAGLTVDETAAIYKTAVGAQRIVYVPDNVGELPFDKLVIGFLSSHGSHVTVPFRGGPITSDAVMADADAAGIRDVAAEVILAGPDTLGISFREMSRELADALSKADIIIAKGQANYYVLSEYGNKYAHAAIMCLFTAKCSHIWQRFGCREKASIAAIIQERKTIPGPS